MIKKTSHIKGGGCEVVKDPEHENPPKRFYITAEEKRKMPKLTTGGKVGKRKWTGQKFYA